MTVHGKPSAVLVATLDLEALLEALEETIEILPRADTLRRLHASDAERGPAGRLRSGRTCTSSGAAAHPAAVDGVDSGVDVRGVLGDRSVAHGRPAAGRHHGPIARERWAGRRSAR